MKRIYVAGTADTKGQELQYVKSLIEAAGGPALLVDVGIKAPKVAVDVAAAEIAAFHPKGAQFVLGSTDRGVAVEAMGEAFARYLAGRGDIAGIIGIGGGGGTSIVTPGMRRRAGGVPKLMVSPPAARGVRHVGGAR